MAETETINDRIDDAPSTRAKAVAIAVAAVVAVLFLAAGVFLAARLVGVGDAWNVEPGLPIQVTIEPGTGAAGIYTSLADAGVARVSDLRNAARALDVEATLKAGTYNFLTDMDAEVVVRQLVTGSNLASSETFTVVEGWTVDRIIAELAGATAFSQAEFQQVLTSGVVTSAYLPESESSIASLAQWEGLLFPATYPIPDDATPASILGSMADEMARRLDTVDWSRIDALGVSRYEAIVVASLIEREAGNDAERPTIASVIYNRIADGMRLQIDATVIYALGYNPGRVTAEHLTVDSPYNTYQIDGLPPTPIGTTSMASLQAAASPATTPYRFYVLGGPEGSHLFAETYEGHQENIRIARESGGLP
jgi:UPF0755 protein